MLSSFGPCNDALARKGAAVGESLGSLLAAFFGQTKPSEALGTARSLVGRLHPRAALAAANPRHRAATCGAAGGAAVCGGAGGVAGLAIGSAFGALCGAVP